MQFITSLILLSNIFLTFSNNVFINPSLHYIKYYEAINPTTTIERKSNDEFTSINFKAFNRKFSLILHPEFTLIENTTIYITTNTTSRNFPFQNIKKKFLIGHVINERNSFVKGICFDKSFQGQITIQDEIYHIESADRYFNRPVPFLSIIFKQVDIDFKRNQSMCNQTIKSRLNIGAQKIKFPKNLNLGRNTICTVKLFADHTFFQHSTDHEIVRVILDMILLLQQAENIFAITDFDGNDIPERLGFQVSNIQIILNPNSPNYRLFDTDIDIEDYLDLFADYDFDKYCLGIAITFRQFKSGALGVTYTASPNPAKAGGICQKRRRAKGQKKPKNYNSVVVTVAGHDGQLMPRFLNGLTVAHELGHAFGSDHDRPGDLECCPNKANAYLMSPYTLRGNHENNYKFSPCSRRQITEVLRAKAFCFIEKTPICGNAIIEPGEECDCGTEDQCGMIDPCCTPKGGLGSDDECTVRVSQGFQCSSIGKPCCTKRCRFVPAHELKDCTGGNDCYYPSSCDGFSADCPHLVSKKNGDECRNGLGRCINSVCIDVICSRRRLIQCECREYKWQCVLCCKDKFGICKPASKFGLWRRKDQPFLRPAGDVCDDEHGFCNFAGKCSNFLTRRAGETIEDRSYNKDKKVVDVVTILIICILVVAVIILLFVIIYIFTPVGSFIQKFHNR